MLFCQQCNCLPACILYHKPAVVKQPSCIFLHPCPAEHCSPFLFSPVWIGRQDESLCWYMGTPGVALHIYFPRCTPSGAKSSRFGVSLCVFTLTDEWHLFAVVLTLSFNFFATLSTIFLAALWLCFWVEKYGLKPNCREREWDKYLDFGVGGSFLLTNHSRFDVCSELVW